MAEVVSESNKNSNLPESLLQPEIINDGVTISDATISNISNDGKISENELENHVFGKNEKERKFRIFGIKFPGEWMDDEIISSILLKSESFHLNFNKTFQVEHYRQGDINITFKTLADAVQAYNVLDQTTVDNVRLKVHTTDHFEKAMTHYNNELKEKIGSDEVLNNIRKPLFNIDIENQLEEYSRRLYVADIPVGMREELFTNIIDLSIIEDYETKVDQIPGGYLQAEIIFKSKSLITAFIAEYRSKVSNREDSFKKTKILTAPEYLMYMEQRIIEENTPIEVDTINIAAEFSTEEISNRIEQYMMKRPISWQEVATKKDMYAICDTVSRQMGGLPDSLLKDAMMATLRKAKMSHQLPIVKNKITKLFGMWKQEVLSEKIFDRETKFKSSAANYIPPPEDDNRKRKRNKKDKTTLKKQMGMGDFLKRAQTDNLIEKYKDTEFEEEPVVEEPLFNENGEPLSFEAWSAISQNEKDVGVVTMNKEEMKKYVKPLKKVVIKKIETPESSNDNGITIEGDKQTREDKEEGEVSTDESSSSDEEDLKRPKKKRFTKTMDTAEILPIKEERGDIGILISKFYDCRVHIIESLNEQQKAGFLQYLKQTANAEMKPHLINQIFAELGNIGK
uniref:RRM domain-containing protein n=1 Tax=Parastrongyloides trichosuri TaxID=131310 RepID=A0A0N4ZS65_PARTI